MPSRTKAYVEHGSRRVRVLGATEHPVRSWALQQARNLLSRHGRCARRRRVRIRWYRAVYHKDMTTQGAGPLLREWRHRRNLTQFELALKADASARHISFLETGRARPGRELLMRLADVLEVPPSLRNELLLAAGYAPVYQEMPADSARAQRARREVVLLVQAHEPYPAIAVDADENIVTMNRAAELVLRDVCPQRLDTHPVNLIRLALHPDGLVRRVVNAAEWRAGLLERLRRQAAHTGRRSLRELYAEVSAYPEPEPPATAPDAAAVACLRLNALGRELRMVGAIASLGAATDPRPVELSVETFYPVDEETAQVFRDAATVTAS